MLIVFLLQNKTFFLLSESNSKFQKYVTLINEAKSSYKPCEDQKGCKCYAPVIENDLKKFKDGISKELVENVKTKFNNCIKCFFSLLI